MNRHLIFVFARELPPRELQLCETISRLEGVEFVAELAELSPHGQTHVVFTSHPYPWELAVQIEKLREDLELSTAVKACHRALFGPSSPLITPEDIPGGPIRSQAALKSATPIIDRVPGMEASPRRGRVHRDFSSQAGLASMAGLFAGANPQMGFGLAD